MLENVGSRLGVGPVMLLSSRRSPRTRERHTISIVNRKKRFIDLLLALRERRASRSCPCARCRNTRSTGWVLARRRRHELDRHRRIARLGARDRLLDLECLDFDAVRAVGRSDEQPDRVAFDDFDRWPARTRIAEPRPRTPLAPTQRPAAQIRGGWPTGRR